MDFGKGSIVDPIHFINDKEFEIIECINHKQIYLVKNQFCQHYYLIKKGEKFDSDEINYLEQSFNLIHPAIINLSGYSIENGNIYYQYSNHDFSLRKITIKYEIASVQKIFIGIASALSYLVSQGYYFPNFSIDSILIDSNGYPKIINYIDFSVLKKRNESKEEYLLTKYVNFLEISLNKIKEEDHSFEINKEFETLINKCKQSQKPTFNDFIEFFKSSSFCGNKDLIQTMPYKKYLEILDLRDIIVYDKFSEKKSLDFASFNSLEQICFYFFRSRKIKTLYFAYDHFLLDTLPEYYIKSLTKLSEMLKKNISQIFI